ncbi:MAG: hypothetical protein C0594_12010 [Marinilabiliales bacterium]|nr:MAG: hypothetical protein C0594_12010 [Marinilabiliales bacterium]
MDTNINSIKEALFIIQKIRDKESQYVSLNKYYIIHAGWNLMNINASMFNLNNIYIKEVKSNTDP